MSAKNFYIYWSLPSRERGLKLLLIPKRIQRLLVAPFAGAWIEISDSYPNAGVQDVAPFAGAWIEIGDTLVADMVPVSRSLRGSVD